MFVIETKNIESITDSIIDENIKLDNSVYSYNGTYVPRVSDILNLIDMDGLIGWGNYIGYVKRQRYADIKKTSTELGTKAHDLIEKYILASSIPAEECIPFNGFLKWWNCIINGNSVEVISTEEKLVCKWFGGTYDLLIRVNGKIYLVDYKTSNHITYKYFMQLSAYRYMLYIEKGINIDGCIILQLNKSEVGYNEYLLDLSMTEHNIFMNNCTTTFFNTLTTLYNVNTIKKQYKGLGF